MSGADEVLNHIDQALGDYAVSGDAMRWTPDPVVELVDGGVPMGGGRLPGILNVHTSEGVTGPALSLSREQLDAVFDRAFARVQPQPWPWIFPPQAFEFAASVGQAFDAAARALGRLGLIFAEGAAASLRRLRLGDRRSLRRLAGGQGDLDGVWQSAGCSGWLHRDCLDPAGSGCGCVCHGGTLR